jgi:hypothetical protein
LKRIIFIGRICGIVSLVDMILDSRFRGNDVEVVGMTGTDRNDEGKVE